MNSNLFADNGRLWSIRALDISGNYGQKIDLNSSGNISINTNGTSRAAFTNLGLILSANSKITTIQNQNIILDASNSLISFQRNGIQYALMDTRFNFTNLPFCSATPTLSSQLVNKSYVDNRFLVLTLSGSNTILINVNQTTITYNTQIWNTGFGTTDLSNITIPRTGYYHFDINTTITSSGINYSYFYQYLYRVSPSPTSLLTYTNNSLSSTAFTGSANYAANCSFIYYLNANDIINIRAEQSSGANRTLSSGSQCYIYYIN